MFDQVVKSLLSWLVFSTLIIITVTYVVSNTVMMGISASASSYTVDKYEAYVVGD